MNSNSNLISLSYQNEIRSVMKAVTCFVYMLSLSLLGMNSDQKMNIHSPGQVEVLP